MYFIYTIKRCRMDICECWWEAAREKRRYLFTRHFSPNTWNFMSWTGKSQGIIFGQECGHLVWQLNKYHTNCIQVFSHAVNSSPLWQNGPRLADDIFKCIFVNEKFCIFIKILLKFVPNVYLINGRIYVTLGGDVWRKLLKPSNAICLFKTRVHWSYIIFFIQGSHYSRLIPYTTAQCLLTPQPSRLEVYCRHGPGGRSGGCQTCGTHFSVTACRIFSVPSSVELSRPAVVAHYGHLPICPTWACPWAKNLSNLPKIGSRLCGTHISETTGWICPI